ncbi:tetratricopeptide repeat protein [Bacillus oleivorans]|uniref:Tetratricopeptide repeat protein n=1 Tax=Bacillus oleivorans TaxID=1448271 RepID=A0A285D2F8_9BACI|nr:tetratricopeptide repeat protein [Bacillus oleivorans]SNX74000.1 tetratricopeptide repeat protein [Bacillus oleivorans]
MEPLQQAILLRVNGHYQEARQLLLSLYEQDKDDPHISYQCAWVHDLLGMEKEAIPFYEHAINQGLSGQERRGALLGLGSTYRTIGEYHQSKKIFKQGMQEFPNANEFPVFLAMTLHNLGDNEKALKILLNKIVELTDDEGIQRYKKAIQFYADKLNEVWD